MSTGVIIAIVIAAIILIFVLLIINDRTIMGRFTNGPVFNAVAWITVVALVLLPMFVIPGACWTASSHAMPARETRQLTTMMVALRSSSE